MKCHYCNEDQETRPYGPKGEPVCFSCAFSTPAKQAQTEKAFLDQLVAAAEAGDGHIVLGEETGPRPLSKKGKRL